MGDLARKILVSIDIDSAGNIFLERTQQIWDGNSLVAPGRPHRQQVISGQTDGIDAFASQTEPGPALASLEQLAGDRWPALQAVLGK